MGSLLIQLLHARGAWVAGAARGDRKLKSTRALGARAAFDYGHEDWTERALASADGRGFDVVLDGVGGDIGRVSLALTAPGGRFIGYGGPSGEFVRPEPGHAARMRSLFDLELAAGDERRLIEAALRQAAAGRLRPVIGQTYPLEQAADAHTAIEARAALGKTLLLP
ncbi:zinc-binding dehydrogenase [Actinomadura darangshiensis]|uniref:zinc-binding dehydrogenase n=1 Tax=Actinomadura darangshiensis TaxID=705336 RepID=UPI001408B75C|nr:zinc-binding dehydrogenase [Actinomadura darangshiensis]